MQGENIPTTTNTNASRGEKVEDMHGSKYKEQLKLWHIFS